MNFGIVWQFWDCLKVMKLFESYEIVWKLWNCLKIMKLFEIFWKLTNNKNFKKLKFWIWKFLKFVVTEICSGQNSKPPARPPKVITITQSLPAGCGLKILLVLMTRNKKVIYIMGCHSRKIFILFHTIIILQQIFDCFIVL